MNQAVSILDFIRNQQQWPTDDVPYWDMNDPRIPNAPRDASAAAVTASACFELYEHTLDETYLSFARSIVKSLSSSGYVLDTSVKALFVLAHSTGDWSKQMELAAPIGFGDYFFLEAFN